MRKVILCLFRAFWTWLRKTLADKCGNFPIGVVKPESKHSIECIDREVVVNKTRVHIRSIFTGQTRLDDAMKKIITRKLSETKKSN